MKKKQKISVDKSTGEILPRYKTQANAHLFPSDNEVNKEPSKTVPNQTLTIAEMVKRHRSGRPIEGSSTTPVYSGEELLPDLSKMDLIDKHAYIDSVADHLVEVRARIEKAKKESSDKAKIEEFEKWHQEKLKAMQQDTAKSNPDNKNTKS